MLCLFGFMCVLALGVMPMVGCSESSSGVACEDNLCPCTEGGILAAIAAGGGPFTFDCDGPTTVVTLDQIEIDNDVILDGSGELTVDGDGSHGVFLVQGGVAAELREIGRASCRERV